VRRADELSRVAEASSVDFEALALEAERLAVAVVALCGGSA
jgi:hypothetical protein